MTRVTCPDCGKLLSPMRASVSPSERLLHHQRFACPARKTSADMLAAARAAFRAAFPNGLPRTFTRTEKDR